MTGSSHPFRFLSIYCLPSQAGVRRVGCSKPKVLALCANMSTGWEKPYTKHEMLKPPPSLWLSLAFQESCAHLLHIFNAVHIANAIVVKFPSGRSMPLADGSVKAWISLRNFCVHRLLLRVAFKKGRKERRQP